MSEVAIKAVELCKSYELRHERRDSEGNAVNEVNALSNLSFEVLKGESIGIIGPNGSGKSTLLKVLASITKPTSGEIEIDGKVASILDIGAGFHPELTGRENVFLNGQLHGFAKSEISKRLNDILEFSGIGDFVDEPVKNYSNGMYLRLAFSTMIHFDFDIYLFDEVFNVGDAAFMTQVRKRRKELKTKTVVTVSHSLQDLSDCDRVFWIENGLLKRVGETSSLISDYLEGSMKSSSEVHTHAVTLNDFPAAKVNSGYELKRFELTQADNDGVFRTDRPLEVRVEYLKTEAEKTIDVLMLLKDATDQEILALSSFVRGEFSDMNEAGIYKAIFTIPPYFLNARIFKLALVFYGNLREEFLQRDSVLKAGMGNDQGNSNIIGQVDNVVSFRLDYHSANVSKSYISSEGTSCNFLVGLDWVKHEKVS